MFMARRGAALEDFILSMGEFHSFAIVPVDMHLAGY
jgi:hypothetical protein